MKYLVVDASCNGTGIRDKYEGYLSPESLGLSPNIINSLNQWLLEYQNEHYEGFTDSLLIDKLDKKGKKIASMIKEELLEIKIEYFSDARMISEIV